MGHTQWKLGQLLRDLGRHEEAEQVYREALLVFEQATRDFPARTFYRQEQAYSHRFLAGLAKARGRVDDAERHYRKAIDLYAALAAEAPENVFYAREEAGTAATLARMLQSLPQPAQAPK